MKLEWQDKEPGPECTCGAPTFVSVSEGNLPIFICIFHTYEAGACFALPKDRPENWPNLTNDEIKELVDRGIKEHELEEEQL